MDVVLYELICFANNLPDAARIVLPSREHGIFEKLIMTFGILFHLAVRTFLEQ